MCIFSWDILQSCYDTANWVFHMGFWMYGCKAYAFLNNSPWERWEHSSMAPSEPSLTSASPPILLSSKVAPCLWQIGETHQSLFWWALWSSFCWRREVVAFLLPHAYLHRSKSHCVKGKLHPGKCGHACSPSCISAGLEIGRGREGGWNWNIFVCLCECGCEWGCNERVVANHTRIETYWLTAVFSPLSNCMLWIVLSLCSQSGEWG